MTTFSTTAFSAALAVADAVLYEGYLLYPYRASAAKNQIRWQWGVLMPQAFADAGSGEHADNRTECLVEPGSHATLHVRLRFLQVQSRTVEVSGAAVPSVTVAGTEYTSWDEAVEREVDAVLRFADLLAGDNLVPFTVDSGEDAEELTPTTRIVRRRAQLDGVLTVRADSLDGPYGGVRLRVDVANTSTAVPADRTEALRGALIAAHSLLAVSPGRFLSMVEPPEWAQFAVAACRNERVWPILVGDPGDEVVLSSPIILYDHPSIAPESAGNLFDGLEIDEILTLRTMALTDEEKREARATDEKAREIVDRVDNMPPELLERLHGTIRYLKAATGEREEVDITARPDVPWWDPGADTSVSPGTDHVIVAGVAVAKGSRVVLRPGSRRSDAQDMFLAGRTALVAAVLSDVDNQLYVAVTLEDDPAADLQIAHGRFRYFSPDEIEPLP
ncbi:hypothetical protein [Actinokineospora sp.]|uniref:hypothetical protein n=1 Tax=Actinokineospora sp. TaxID=1872133 RepID=UPI004037E739